MSQPKVYAIIEELLSETPPSPVYHYTSASCLREIVVHREVWATDIHYLNDRREFFHALDMAEEMLRERAGEHGELLAEFLRFKGRLFDPGVTGSEGSLAGVFVFSLSKLGDDLSQWRAYCPMGGHAIGFDPVELNNVVRRSGFALLRCIYKEKHQQALLARLIDTALSDPDSTPSDFADATLMVAPLMKDRAFEAEKEWRVVPVGSMSAAIDGVDFRGDGDRLRPYFRLPIAGEGAQVPVIEITVGPTVDQDLATAATRKLVQRFGGDIRVIPTKIPYRTW